MIPMAIQSGASYKLIDVASGAGVKRVIPNKYSGDYTNEEFGKDVILGPMIVAKRKYIESEGKMSWIAISCSFDRSP